MPNFLRLSLGHPLNRHAILLLTTALIGFSLPLAFASAARGQAYLDNVDQADTNGVNPGSGTWSAAAAIWSDANGRNHRALKTDETAILAAESETTPPITINILGTVSAGGITAERGSFTLSGGTIRGGGSEPALQFSTKPGVKLAVSSALEGKISNTGTGTLAYSGAVTGSFLNQDGATAIMQGSVSGELRNRGTLTTNGNLTAKTLINEKGTATVAEGSTLTAQENVVNDATLTVDGTLQGNVINNKVINGKGAIRGTLDNKAAAELAGSVGRVEQSVAGATLTTKGDLTIGTLSNTGDATVTVAEGTTLTSGNLLVNAGKMNVLGSVSGKVSNSGTLNVSGKTLAELINAGTLIADKGTLTDLTNQAKATATLKGATVSGTIVNDGSLTGTGTLSGTTTNRAQMDFDGTIARLINGQEGSTDPANATAKLSGSVQNATNYGTIETKGNLTVGTLDNRALATVRAGETLTGNVTNASGGTVNILGAAAGGTIDNAGTLDLGAGAKVDNVTNRGKTVLYGDVNATGDFINNGSVENTTRNVLLTVGKTFTNDGDVIANNGRRITIAADKIVLKKQTQGNVDLRGATVNLGTMLIDTDRQLSYSLTNGKEGALAGTLTVTANLDANGQEITNDATMHVNSGGVTDAAKITNTGTLDVLKGARISSRNGIINSGTLNAVGAIGGNVTNSGTLKATGGISGDVVNDAAGIARLSGRVTGTIRNSGDFATWGDMEVGGLTNSKTAQIAANTTLASSTEISNSGTLTIDGTATGGVRTLDGGTTNVSGTVSGGLVGLKGSTTRLASGTINGALDNAGTLTGTGTVNGDLSNQDGGSATIAGTVTGRLGNAGTLTTAGDLSVRTLLNSAGSAQIMAGHTLTAQNGASNTAGLTINGTLRGALTNNSAGTTTLASGTLDGAVENSGKLLGDGTVNGNITSEAGSTTELSGTVTGKVTNRGTFGVAESGGGKLTVAGLDNAATATIAAGRVLTSTADVINRSGLTVAGTLAGNLDNRLFATTTLSGGTIQGAVSNNGALTGAGTITGALTNTGAVTTTGQMNTGGIDNQSGGRIDVAKDTNLISTADIGNSGRVTVAGTLTGNVTNRAQGELSVSGAVAGGVANSGTLKLSAGTITGDVSNDGLTELSGTSTVSGNFANNTSGSIRDAGTDAVLNIAKTFTNNGTIAATSTGSIRINAGSIVLKGTTSGNVVLNGATSNSGTLYLNTDRTLLASLTNNADGRVIASANIDVGGYQVTNAGDFDVTRTGTMRNISTLTNSGTLGIVSGGAVSAQQIVNLKGGRVDNKGTMTGPFTNQGNLSSTGTLAGNLTNEKDASALLAGSVTGGIVNRGTLETTGDLRVSAFANDAAATVAKDTTLTSDSVTQNTGTLDIKGTLAGGLNNTISGRTTLDGGRVNGAINNAGNISGNGTLAGDVTNAGTLATSGRIGGTLTNLASGRAAISGVVTGNVDNRGILETSGDLSVAGLANAAGATLNAVKGTTLRSSAAITNSGVVQGGGVIAADLVNSGTLRTTGEIRGNLTNSTTGVAELSGRVSGTITNSGNLTTTGDLETNALDNQKTALIIKGTTLTSANVVSNSGTLTVDGTLTGGVKTLAGGSTVVSGSVNGGLTNLKDGFTRLAGGTVNGTLDNAGTLVAAGIVNGQLSNSGTLTTSGDLKADTLVNSAGSAQIGAGHTLSVTRSASNDSTLTVAGTLRGTLTNGAKGTVTLSAGTLDGAVSNAGILVGSGTITGDVTGSLGSTTTLAGEIRGKLVNHGTLSVSETGGGKLSVGSLENRNLAQIDAGRVLAANDGSVNHATLTIAGTLASRLDNREGASVTLNSGTIQGNVGNSGTLTGTGTINGSLENTATGVVRATGRIAGNVVNGGTLTTVGDLAVGGLTNAARADIAAGHRLSSASTIINKGAMSVAGALDGPGGNSQTLLNESTAVVLGTGTLVGAVENRRDLTNDGVIRGGVTNSGTLTGRGTIDGALLNSQTARLSGSVTGLITNRGDFTTAGKLTVGGMVNAHNFTIRGGDQLISGQPVRNEKRMSIAGLLTGDLVSLKGAVTRLEGGEITGSFANSGDFLGRGKVTGNMINTGDMRIDQALALGNMTNGGTLTIAGHQILKTAGQITNTASGTINLQAGAGTINLQAGATAGSSAMPTIDGKVLNEGHIKVDAGKISGTLTNNGVVDLRNNQSNSVLNLAGVSGNGTYLLDIDTSTMSSDLIRVRGGAATGNLKFTFSPLNDNIVRDPGKRVVVFDADAAQGAANNFTYDVDNIPAASERIVFSLERDRANGNLTLVSQVNPAIGAIFGNVALTQSLIGSVVNRPTSPFVVDLAYQDKERPCGAGAWARAIGGRADARGATDNGVSRIGSKVSANYSGIQFGSDMACFDGYYDGWNMAFGVLGGVNTGRTEQPIFAVDKQNASQVTSQLASVTSSDFKQFYGGVYITATRGPLAVDLQYRREKMDFDLSNAPVGNAASGLGLKNAKFSTAGDTLSGSVSYAVPISQTGLQIVPTAGFAWSRLSVDEVKFSDGYRLDMEDSQRKIGFVGATVSKTFVYGQKNAALNLFATGTYYKDFADPVRSRFYHATDHSFTPQNLTSDNLGAYGEVSLGFNYVKVLESGSFGRQFSASGRIDARTGSSLDSLGLTGQVRWQF